MRQSAQLCSGAGMAGTILGMVVALAHFAQANSVFKDVPSLRDKNCTSPGDCLHLGRKAACRDGLCTCRPDYMMAIHYGKVQCVAEPTFGGECSDFRPCSNRSGTICYNGTCFCEDDYVFYLDRCERQTLFSSYEEPFVTPPKYNILTVIIIVAILIVALLFLVNKRSVFFYFPCCMRDTVQLATVVQAENRNVTEFPVRIDLHGAEPSQVSLHSCQQQDKPPSYMDTVLNVQYLPSYQEAAARPPKPS